MELWNVLVLKHKKEHICVLYISAAFIIFFMISSAPLSLASQATGRQSGPSSAPT